MNTTRIARHASLAALAALGLPLLLAGCGGAQQEGKKGRPTRGFVDPDPSP